jgi:hypothetical protein
VRTVVFRYFSKEIEKGRETWAEASISKPRPTVRDFDRNYVTIPKSLLDSVNKHLEDTGFCLIVGPPSSGKTWLTYRIGYYLSFVKKKHVWYATVDENFTEKDAWNEIEHYYEDKIKDTVYFVIEDSHLNRDEVEKFLLRIYDERERNMNLKFIFNTRKVGRYILRDDKIQDTFYDICVDRLKCQLRLSPTEIREIAKGMIRNFVLIKGLKQDLSEDKLSSIVEKWGSDLYIVYLYLRSWDPEKHPKLIDVDKERIHDFIWNGGGEICLGRKNQREILCRIAAICQFEPLKIPDSFLRMKSIDEDELSSLIRKGTVQIYPQDFIGISEDLAQLVLSTIIAKDMSFKKEYIKNLFEDYVRLAMNGPRPLNWNLVFQALFLAKDESSKLARS